MFMKSKSNFILGGMSGLLTALLIALVRKVDVASIGPKGTSIGLSHLNQMVHQSVGVHDIWYKITELLGGVALLVVGIFALVGFVQLLQRKSLVKVDQEIYALGGLYAVMLVLYAVFEKVVINYRPVVMAGETAPEASFPSSHTMLTCVVMGSAMMILHQYIKSEGLQKILQVVCGLILVVTVVGRLVSGVHWFTDIVGGVLISITLLSIFAGVVKCLDQERE